MDLALALDTPPCIALMPCCAEFVAADAAINAATEALSAAICSCLVSWPLIPGNSVLTADPPAPNNSFPPRIGASSAPSVALAPPAPPAKASPIALASSGANREPIPGRLPIDC